MKNSNKNIDFLLKRALTIDEIPDQDLVDIVKYRAAINKKSRIKTKAKTFSLSKIIVAAILSSMLISTTAYAAWNLLTPKEVPAKINDTKLSQAFESDSAITINNSVISNNFKFTLTGIVSGDNISNLPNPDIIPDDLRSDRTYAIVAIQTTDGSPIPDIDENPFFFYSAPLIKGIDPQKFFFTNSMFSASRSFVADNVMYIIHECDNLNMFSDRGVYLGICTAIQNNVQNAFILNEQSGEITPNADYEKEVNGSSVIFELPLDINLADPIKADAYLKENLIEFGVKDLSTFDEWLNNREKGLYTGPDSVTNGDVNVLFDIDWENAIPIEDSVQQVTVDENGSIEYNYQSTDPDYDCGDMYCVVDVASIFPEDNTDNYGIFNVVIGTNDIFTVRFNKNDDGTISAAVVYPVKQTQ